MGRQLRRVAANWQHPTDEAGNYIPLYGGSYQQALANYNVNVRQWAKGMRRSFDDPEGWVPRTADERNMTFAEWDGGPPVASEYMPDWEEAQLTHFQYYETTTEGTPISPPLPSLRELTQWLVTHKVPFEGDEPGLESQWYSYLHAELPMNPTWDFPEELAPRGTFSSVQLFGESPRREQTHLLQAIRVATHPWFVIIWQKLTEDRSAGAVPGPQRTQPYCCYVRTVIFYHKPYTLTADGTEYQRYTECESVLRVDDVIEFEGERFDIGPGTVVWYQGAWYMRKWGRRQKGSDLATN